MLPKDPDFPRRFLKAVQASQKKYDVYAIERDWAEFDVAGREPVGLDDPAVYFPALCVRRQKIGWEDAFAEYAFAACGHTSPVPHAAPTGLASRFRIRTRLYAAAAKVNTHPTLPSKRLAALCVNWQAAERGTGTRA